MTLTKQIEIYVKFRWHLLTGAPYRIKVSKELAHDLFVEALEIGNHRVFEIMKTAMLEMDKTGADHFYATDTGCLAA